MKVVNCTTQYEWDFVNEKLTIKGLNLPINYWDEYKDLTCKNLDRDTYGDLSCYKGSENTIYSFNEWCILNNYLEGIILEEIIDEDLSYLIRLFKKLKIK